jgi:hypothetical protein
MSTLPEDPRPDFSEVDHVGTVGGDITKHLGDAAPAKTKTETTKKRAPRVPRPRSSGDNDPGRS